MKTERIEKIRKILDLHGVPNYTENGNIYADSMISGKKLFEEVENVTDWTKSQLYIWLGYWIGGLKWLYWKIDIFL